MNKNKSLPKYSSSRYIKKEIKLLLYKLFTLKRNLIIFLSIIDKNDRNYFLEYLPNMSTVILDSLNSRVILELSKLIVDSDNNDLSIQNLLSMYKKHNNIFKQKEYVYIFDKRTGKRKRFYIKTIEIKDCFDKLKCDLDSCSMIKETISVYRNKLIAHNNKSYNYDCRLINAEEIVLYEDIRKLVELLINDLNDIHLSIFGNKIEFAYYENKELKLLKDSFYNYIKGVKKC